MINTLSDPLDAKVNKVHLLPKEITIKLRGTQMCIIKYCEISAIKKLAIK